jgi:hypothetical protein
VTRQGPMLAQGTPSRFNPSHSLLGHPIHGRTDRQRWPDLPGHYVFTSKAMAIKPRQTKMEAIGQITRRYLSLLGTS